MSYLLVFVGGGIGAALRHAVNRVAFALLGPSFPFGTLIVNVIGSFLMGVLAAALVARGETDQSLRLFLGTGVLGGFTTFSAFSLDAVVMWEKAEWLPLAAYLIGSVALPPLQTLSRGPLPTHNGQSKKAVCRDGKLPH
jgi:CrcB protein